MQTQFFDFRNSTLQAVDPADPNKPATFEQAMARAYDAARNQLLERVQGRIAHALPLLQPRAAGAGA